MIYTPLALPENQKSVYNPPTLETLTNLLKSTSNLEILSGEFRLNMPAKELDKKIKVATPYNAAVVSITVDWPDPATGPP